VVAVSRNPYFDALDETLRGRHVRVVTQDDVALEGWVDRIHHQQRNVLLRSAHDASGDPVGTAMVANARTIVETERAETIEEIDLEAIEPSPYHAAEFTEVDNDDFVREVRDTGYAGSYPVVRDLGGEFEIVEGHKRIWACRQAGLESHPVAVVDIDGWAAAKRFVVDHLPDRELVESDRRFGFYDDPETRQAIEALVDDWGEDVLELDRVAFNARRLEMDVVDDEEEDATDGEQPEHTPAIRRVETDETEDPDETSGDEDLVIVGTGANGMSKYHRDELCAYAARLNNPRERPLSVLGDAEPCSNCCPEAEEEDDGSEDDVSRDETVEIEVPDDAVEEDLGTYEVRDYATWTIVLGADVAREFDADSVTVRDMGGWYALTSGTSEEWPDYTVTGSQIKIGKPGCEVIGAEPGDEIRAVAVGDVVRLEPVGEFREVPPEATGEAETVYVTSGHKNVFHRDEDCERAQRSSNVYERSELQVDDLEECTFCGGGEVDDTEEEEDDEDADESIDDLLDDPEPDGDEDEVDEADQGDADEVPEYRSCSCGETFADSLEYRIHRTEDHGKPQGTLGHLEPGEFEETVNDVGGVQELGDELGFSTERTLRILNVYGLEDAVGPGDVEISDVNDFEFDGVVDGHDVATGEFWCGFCGEGPLDTEAAVREHHQDERHAGEAAVRSEDPSIEVENASTSRADGGVAAIMSSTDGPGQRCQNCGSHVTKHYARIHTPEGEEEKGPRVCPNCEDKVREGDGTVREARAPRRASGNGGPS